MFNLKKHSQIDDVPESGLNILEEATDGLKVQVDNKGISNPANVSDPVNINELAMSTEQERAVENVAAQKAWQAMMEIAGKFNNNGIDVTGILNSNPEFINLKERAESFDIGSFTFDPAIKTKIEQAAVYNISHANTVSKFEAEAKRAFELLKDQQNLQNLQNQRAAFNLKKTKAQVDQVPLFPVLDSADLANKLFERLLSNNDTVFANASNEVLSQFKGDIQEQDVKDILDRFWNLDPEQDQEQAMELFGLLFELLPGNLKQMEPTMGSNDNPKGIIKFNLSDHVLNNQEHKAKTEFLDGLKKDASSGGMIKTAADQFGQQYVLYGPSEKRICPKLRGKGGGQPGSGDVVSEYICRHHCLDGIVIDDNKTICGEALWRANVADNFSRDYVDEDGNLVGGYINKRFEINRLVPEENKMRLKPGELRKPRPAEWGSTESRMQAMRQAEGEARGYTPTNTGDAFEWCHDSDQNNVGQSQAERDRREKAMGHIVVEYKNREQGENNPKIASKKFNLKKHATVQENKSTDNTQEKKTAFNLKKSNSWGISNIHGVLTKAAAKKSLKENVKYVLGNNDIKPKKFNLKKMKEAQMSPSERETYNFEEGEAKLRGMNDDQLLYTLKDLWETIEIQEAANRDPKGNMVTPKLGYYWDELHTLMKILKERGIKVNKDMQRVAQGSIPVSNDGRPIEPVETPIRNFDLKKKVLSH